MRYNTKIKEYLIWEHSKKKKVTRNFWDGQKYSTKRNEVTRIVISNFDLVYPWRLRDSLIEFGG